MNWLKQQEWRDSVLAEGGTVLEQDDNYPEILRPFYFRNRKQQFAETWENAPTDKKIVIAATGVGTASQVIPYAGDYGSLLSSAVVVAAEPSWDAAGDILLDAAGAVLPFFPAFGTIRRVERTEDIGRAVEGTVDTAKDIVKYKNVKNGITVEDPTGNAASKIYDAPKRINPAPEQPYFNPQGTAGAARAWTKSARIKNAQLPNRGKIRYVPPVPPINWHPSEPLPRGPNGGYKDRFGNEWTRGPSRTQGQPFEWDVQLGKNATPGMKHVSPDAKHVNVSLDGRVTH